MSQCPDVDRSRIDLFLRELGRRFRHPARLYLVGGTTLVYESLRGATLDVDFAVEVDPAYHGDFMRTISVLKDQLPINAEEASPAGFIPLPTGWQGRSPFVGRYGQVEVFHFDPVSTALSKLARGFEEDLRDVQLLLSRGLVARLDLQEGWASIAGRLPEQGWSKTEIAEFEANLHRALIPGDDGPT